MGNQLRSLRNRAGWTHQVAADRMGISRDHFIKLERGDRNLTAPMIAKAAAAFGTAQTEIIADSGSVPIVGLVGAGGSATITFVSDGELGEAPKPPAGNDRTVAVEVRGASMRGVADDGWLVYYDDVRSPITEDMIGELCVLWLNDGQVVIKKPYPSRAAGRYDLESTSAETLRGVVVDSAAFVTFLAPARTARAVIRRSA